MALLDGLKTMTSHGLQTQPISRPAVLLRETTRGSLFWNLYQLANALRQLDIDEKSLIQCLDNYKNRYIDKWQKTFVKKLGV